MSSLTHPYASAPLPNPPTPYHAYAPEVPYTYVSNPATPCPPSPWANPLHHLSCLRSHSALYICIQPLTPSSSPPQIMILTLLQYPLMFSIDNPYAFTVFGFCPNS
ncbi:hypothetical protein O181_015877 [Austropuccinia psidii MF-1]|uniref:Uncharacterized protein n=1 Tax=Austropuccinia psidii MF-1 TaxID=1389203 RepID=A0A9Q3C4I5_9BASI|nr:hypothetical protein [Austropuccinia psidii MF-1]